LGCLFLSSISTQATEPTPATGLNDTAVATALTAEMVEEAYIWGVPPENTIVLNFLTIFSDS
jgi:hypothetical protein